MIIKDNKKYNEKDVKTWQDWHNGIIPSPTKEEAAIIYKIDEVIQKNVDTNSFNILINNIKNAYKIATIKEVLLGLKANPASVQIIAKKTGVSFLELDSKIEYEIKNQKNKEEQKTADIIPFKKIGK